MGCRKTNIDRSSWKPPAGYVFCDHYKNKPTKPIAYCLTKCRYRKRCRNEIIKEERRKSASKEKEMHSVRRKVSNKPTSKKDLSKQPKVLGLGRSQTKNSKSKRTRAVQKKV